MTAPTQTTQLAFDDTGGRGRLAVLIPGAGDVRSEYRFVVGPLAAAGYRVITADLPGHGGSAPAPSYSVADAAGAIRNLIESLDAGPAVVVATSFAPAAAVWAAVERPGTIDAIVAISPHLHADGSAKGRLTNTAIRALLRGPWAAGLWVKLYTGWYKQSPPSDLEAETAKLRRMLADAARRRAVRRTLTASRHGVDQRIEQLDVPTLTIFGSEDDHFADPSGAATSTADELGGEALVVEGAGHYPHVEQPTLVADAIVSFLGRTL
jgi:pimeloyl-ACP methyl ester carboxylesterase